jgi:hypothetical protein
MLAAFTHSQHLDGDQSQIRSIKEFRAAPLRLLLFCGPFCLSVFGFSLSSG